MTWTAIVVAGLLEAAWSVGMKLTEGFTRPLESALTLLAIAGSMGLLAVAMRELPDSTAYAVWVGIGVVGSAVLGAVLFGEPLTPQRMFFLVTLIGSVVGLEATSHHPPAPEAPAVEG